MARKLTNSEYIIKCKEKFGDKYDYSKTFYNGKREKVIIICPIHGEFSTFPLNFLKGIGCMECYYEEQRISTMKNYIEKSKVAHNNFYDYSSVNLLGDDMVDIICPKHGHFKQNIKDHMNGHGCCKCANERKSEEKKRKYSYDELIKDSSNVHGNKYSYPLQEIKYFYDECTIICPIHGEFKQKINYHIQMKQGCPKCGMEKFHLAKKYDIDKVISLFNEINVNNNFEFIVESYENMNSPSLFKCKTCNNEFRRPLSVFINSNNTCPYCNKEINSKNRFKTTEEFINEANIVHNFYYDYSITNYTKSKEYVEIICPEHGVFKIEANSHLQGHGCPLHNCNVSKQETELANYVISLVGEENVILNSKKILNSKQELDIYLPKFNLAFEFNGLYWHNELNKDKNYHLNKTNECNSQGIRLFHVFEDEWIHKKEIIKSMISNILHKNETKIYARQCEIKEIDAKTSYDFLTSNHLQGNCNGLIKLGLFYNNELVSLMVFGSSRHFIGSGRHTYELLRFCNKLNTNIIGGASKLFKHFIEKFQPNDIISYADKRWSLGNLYNTLGFSLYNESKPNYYYVIGDKRVYRYNLRKDVLIKKYNCPQDKTEKEFCFEQKWYRIYDCGCLCYKWTKKQ